MTLRTPLAQVRGLGSAKEGVHHWWLQRLSGAALVPLTLWFIFSIAGMSGADHAAFAAWAADPFNAVLLILLVAATFQHVHLGLQVVIEDYIHGGAAKLILLVGSKFGCFILATAGIFAILKVAFGG
ncbi:succinate dehydrogenase, hydrophobic membrane anchor protein [Aestuariispira insulae]|uniref:Succinate dehydrogenase hydrophobic membrane anchor subunit n=1 Tax=Aestuariispira insulae TaxID=1461337 RepID=A0A3D9HXR0_9PROT|nr:succinate dehydrogenase, hydrophobic membrane anchor protein [Aestuariispira insulae]RED54284.1 succinate dehydrogenase subunit D [Aestuariispira insulae]